MSLERLLESGKKPVTAEITPPHGTDLTTFLHSARVLGPHVNAFNITDNQRALMRMSGLACAAVLLQNGFEPIYQMTCRDRNVLALQSDLLGAAALGVKNVLALTGDPVAAGDTPEAKGVFQFEATGLLRLIEKLNSGTNVNGKSLAGTPKIFAGAAVNPGGRSMDPQIRRLEKKMKSGAHFFQTQPVFDPAQMELFMSRVRPLGAKIIAGVFLIRSLKTARFLHEKVPGIFVPDDLFKKFEKARDQERVGVDFAASLVKHYMGLCDGVHLMAMRAEEKLVEVLEIAGVKKEGV